MFVVFTSRRKWDLSRIFPIFTDLIFFVSHFLAHRAKVKLLLWGCSLDFLLSWCSLSAGNYHSVVLKLHVLILLNVENGSSFKTHDPTFLEQHDSLYTHYPLTSNGSFLPILCQDWAQHPSKDLYFQKYILKECGCAPLLDHCDIFKNKLEIFLVHITVEKELCLMKGGVGWAIG